MSVTKRIALLIKKVPRLMPVAYFFWSRIQARYTVGVAGVVFNEKGQVLLAEHAFHPKTPWGLPGGWVGRNEDPALTIKREFEEELQLTIDVGNVLLIDKPLPGHLDIAYLCYAKGDIGSISYELLSWQWFDPQSMPRILSFQYKAVHKGLSVIRGRDGE